MYIYISFFLFYQGYYWIQITQKKGKDCMKRFFLFLLKGKPALKIEIYSTLLYSRKCCLTWHSSLLRQPKLRARDNNLLIRGDPCLVTRCFVCSSHDHLSVSEWVRLHYWQHKPWQITKFTYTDHWPLLSRNYRENKQK